MFSSLSTLVQFLGAIYVTIVFDNILFRRFWSPDYYTLLYAELQHFDLPQTSDIKKWLNSIKDKNHIFQEHSRKRGAIFLYTSFVTLMCCGIIGDSDSILEYPFVVLYLFSYIMVFLMPSVMSRWIWLLLSIMVETIIFVASFFFQPFDIYIGISVTLKRLILSLLLLLPILYQVIKSWFYSTALKCYYIQELNHISAEYKDVRRALDEKNSSCIPSTYNDAFVKNTFEESDKEDRQLTSINKILLEQLSKALSNYSYKKLFKAYISNPPKNEKEEISLIDEYQSVNTYNKEYKTYTDVVYIKSMVALYEQTDPRPKIEAFCEDHRIDVTTFRNYRNANKHKK